MLALEHITKSFDDTLAITDVSLSVRAGEIVCLLGPSGCGKTTLLRLVAGLETADAGQLLLNGRDLATVPPHQRDFGMVFQDYALFPHKNVYENIAFGLRMKRDNPQKIVQVVAEMLALVELTGYEQRHIDQLSGGERQRVALARSLATQPRLLLLDEPLGALDRALRERLLLDLRRILKQVGVTALTVTHDQTEAFALADTVVVMNRGRIEQIDTPEQLYTRPRTPFVARFLGFHNLLLGRKQDEHTVLTAIGPLHTAAPVPQADVQLLIRPEAAQLVFDQKGNNIVRGQVLSTSFRGRYYQVRVQVDDTALLFELPTAPSSPDIALALAPDKLLFL